MSNKGFPVYQDYAEYDLAEEDLAEPDFYVDRFFSDLDLDEMDDDGGGLAPFSVSEILEHCIEPTLTDGIKHMGKIIVWCMVFRTVTQTSTIPSWLRHLASVVTGALVAMHFFGTGVSYLLSIILLGYIMLSISRRVRGQACAALILSFNIVAETWLAEPVVWHMIRGPVMIIAMKIISLGFDMDSAEVKKEKEERDKLEEASKEESVKAEEKIRNSKTTRNRGKKVKQIVDPVVEEEEEDPDRLDLTKLPSILEFSGYCLCPGTVVLGPWVSYEEYINIFKDPKWNITWLIKILFTVMFAFMFLTISTCWNPWLIPNNGWKWWLAYRDAMSFRASHYFVSFMSEASVIAAGFGAHSMGTHILWHYTVTQPHNVEVPRSLVEVVVSWNMPMHRWLKLYVFKQAKPRAGAGVAVVLTYLASTVLHGLTGQIAAVLFSLGAYTWVEHSLRTKLSNIMDASIGARRETETRKKHREGSSWVILVNLIFGLLTMFHLAYLGVMFDQSSPDQVTGYSWAHTLEKWRRLDFTSHWVVGVMALTNWLI